MITLRGRELVIPVSERQIGTNYDNNSEVRQFRLPRVNPGGIDVSHLDFILSLEYASETRDECLLKKEVDDDRIVLTWEITDRCVQAVGTVWVWIRAHDSTGAIKWASNKGAFYVYGKLGDTEEYSGLTELEQMETLLGKVLEAYETTINNIELAEECAQSAQEASQSAADSKDAAADSASEAKTSEKRAEASASTAEEIVGFNGSAETVMANDSQGMTSDPGEKVTLQTLIDAVADKVMNQLLTKAGLVNNALATEAGVAALDAVMGKTLQDQITQQNSNLTPAELTLTEESIVSGSKFKLRKTGNVCILSGYCTISSDTVNSWIQIFSFDSKYAPNDDTYTVAFIGYECNTQVIVQPGGYIKVRREVALNGNLRFGIAWITK